MRDGQRDEEFTQETINAHLKNKTSRLHVFNFKTTGALDVFMVRLQA
jgi:hypothetical protein